MDLNEAIDDCKNIARSCNNENCRKKHWMFVRWFQILKRMGDDMFTMRYLIKSNHPEAFDRIKTILMEYEKE